MAENNLKKKEDYLIEYEKHLINLLQNRYASCNKNFILICILSFIVFIIFLSETNVIQIRIADFFINLSRKDLINYIPIFICFQYFFLIYEINKLLNIIVEIEENSIKLLKLNKNILPMGLSEIRIFESGIIGLYFVSLRGFYNILVYYKGIKNLFRFTNIIKNINKLTYNLDNTKTIINAINEDISKIQFKLLEKNNISSFIKMLLISIISFISLFLPLFIIGYTLECELGSGIVIILCLFSALFVHNVFFNLIYYFDNIRQEKDSKYLNKFNYLEILIELKNRIIKLMVKFIDNRKKLEKKKDLTQKDKNTILELNEYIKLYEFLLNKITELENMIIPKNLDDFDNNFSNFYLDIQKT